MRQTLNDICGLVLLAPFAAVAAYGLLAEDPMQVEIGRRAAAEAQVDECAADILRPLYARGGATPEQVEAAYRDCE